MAPQIPSDDDDDFIMRSPEKIDYDDDFMTPIPEARSTNSPGSRLRDIYNAEDTPSTPQKMIMSYVIETPPRQKDRDFSNQLRSAQKHFQVNSHNPVQYGLQESRTRASDAFIQQATPYHRVDVLNQIVVYKCLLQKRTLEEALTNPETSRIYELLGDTLQRALVTLYNNVATLYNQQIQAGNIDNAEDFLIKNCCQEGLRIARDFNIPVQFDITDLNLEETRKGRASFTSSEFRELARLYNANPHYISHVSIYENGHKLTPAQIESIMEPFRDLSPDRTPARRTHQEAKK